MAIRRSGQSASLPLPFIRPYFGIGTNDLSKACCTNGGKIMRIRIAIKTALATGIVAALLAGTTRANAQKINGAGATFPAPIYQKWFFEYNKTHPGVTFNYAAVGSGGGIDQYKAGTVDVVATDAPLSDAEQSSMPQPTLHIPTVAGAVVMAYNVPGIGTGMKLSGETISGIYLGHITTWNHPAIAKDNPGAKLPASPITVVHRSDGSGTSYIYTSYLSAVSGEWNSKIGVGKSVNWPIGIGGKGSDGVAGLIKNSPGSIGYVELAYALQNKLHYGTVEDNAGK